MDKTIFINNETGETITTKGNLITLAGDICYLELAPNTKPILHMYQVKSVVDSVSLGGSVHRVYRLDEMQLPAEQKFFMS